MRPVSLLVLSMVGGCASTQMLSTWKDPNAGALSFKKVLVVSPAQDPAMRRAAEDELASEITAAQAVPSYRIIPEGQIGDEQSLRARATAAGFDGMVVMRVVSVDREATWVPGTWSGPYMAYGYGYGYDPGYMRVDTYARVETNVYSLPDERLVWASASRTVNPGGVRSLVDDTAKAVAKEMRKQGLLPNE